MKQFLKVTGLLLLISTLLVNNNFTQAQDTDSKADSMIINQLMSEAKQLMVSEPDSAIALLNQAFDLHQATGPYQSYANTLRYLADANRKTLNYTRSLDYYLQAIKEINRTGTMEEMALVYWEIGELYLDWNVKEKAADYLVEAYKRFLEIGDLPNQEKLLSMIGKLYGAVGEVEKSITYYEKLLEMYKRSDHRILRIEVLRSISDIYLKDKQYELALEYDKQILHAYTLQNDSIGMANSYNNLGFLYKYLSQYDLSLSYFKRSLQLTRKLNTIDIPSESEYTILINIGFIYRDIENYDQAVFYFIEALNACPPNKPEEKANVHNQIAYTYQMAGDINGAIANSQMAVDLAKQTRNVELLMLSYKRISEILASAKRNSEALEYFKLHTSLKDSILQKEREKEHELLEKQLEIEKIEKDLKLVLADKDKKELELSELKLINEKRGQQIQLLEREKELQDIRLQNQNIEKAKAFQELKLAQRVIEVQKKDKEISNLQKDKYIQSLTLKEKELQEKERQRELDLLQKSKALQELELSKEKNLKSFMTWIMILLLVIIVMILISLRVKRLTNNKLSEQNAEIQRQNVEIQEQRDKLEQSFKNVKLLSEIGRDITLHLSIEKIVDIVYENVNNLMDATVFGIGIVKEDNKLLEFHGAKERGEKLPLIMFDLDEEKNRLATICYNENKEILINDYQSEYIDYYSAIPSSKTGQDAKSIIYLPLVVKDKRIGVITVQSFQKNVYNDYHLDILKNLVVNIAIALENAAAYQQITEKSNKLEMALLELKNAQAQLIQSEKMASIGQLTAGIAHEINNPINFVYAGVESLNETLRDLQTIVFKYQELETNNGDLQQVENILHQLQELKEELYFEETLETTFEVVKAIKEGALRTAEIVKGLRSFSRPTFSEREPVDIHEHLDNTILLLNPKTKNKIKIYREYSDIRGEVHCIPGQLNQVFLNILNNAIQAIEDKGMIRIKTIDFENNIEIRIKDSGRGIDQDVRKHIFEPFFTTKPVGQGTGLGLSISYGIIQKHQGAIAVQSEPGTGTEFIISLPKGLAIDQKQSPEQLTSQSA